MRLCESSSSYGSQQQRVYELYQENGVLWQTKQIVGGGLYERIARSDGTPVQHRHRISLPGGASATWTFNDGQSQTQGEGHYVVGDHLGSSSLVLKLDGTTDEFSYDAWGNPRSVTTWQRYGQNSDWPNYHYNQGFTGHRMIKGMKWIDMQGRLYDPNTGRFLSADPFVQ